MIEKDEYSEINVVWDFVYTSENATIAILEENFENITLNNESIPDGALIGVFFINDNGDYISGGYVEFDNTQNFALTAWGDDSTTPEQDGFQQGDSYIWFLNVGDFDALNLIFSPVLGLRPSLATL